MCIKVRKSRCRITPQENDQKFLMKLLPSLPIRYNLIGYGEKNGQASNVDYGEENPTGPNYTKICGHKFHKYVQHMLRKQAEQICSEMDKVMQLLL